MSAWSVTDGPEEWMAQGDSSRYVYRLGRESQSRSLAIDLSGMVLAAHEHSVLDGELAEAVRTRGRSVVETFLNDELPPERVRIDAEGIRWTKGREVAR